MNYKIIFHPEAEAEFNEAVLWYSTQQKGLELEFVRCIDEAIQKVKKNPFQYQIIFKSYRRKVVRRFPFIIVYENSEKTLHILGVFHSRRNPETVQSRV